MKISVGQLRELFQQGLAEGKVGAHADYLKKERVREALQAMIVEAIGTGDIKSQKDLDSFIATVTMANSALKMVPFEVYKKMSAG